jgi:hypothetical protein
MEDWHWAHVPETTMQLLRVGMSTDPRPTCVFDPGPQGLRQWIPRAVNVRETVVNRLTAEVLTGQYKCQEKLNGVYVVWDGARLWTKYGNPIRSDECELFMKYLPPGFALVGELYLGNGPHERDIAATLSNNKLPALKLLPSGIRNASRSRIWNHARLVAFDVPGLGAREDAMKWSYAARYELLRHVVGAWSRKITDPSNESIVHTALPLQLIRQYDMIHLPALFQEVVHGEPWEMRKYPGFGIPKTVKFNNQTRHEWRANPGNGWLPEDGDVVTLFHKNVRSSGEGLMLWRQDAPWQTMATQRRTHALLKYKPTIVSMGVVFSAPEHTHHRNIDDAIMGDEKSRLPGYQIRLRWWDKTKGHWTYIVPYIPSVLEPARVLAMYPIDQAVFFTFVMYESKPLYVRALGSALSHRDAVSVQDAAAWAVRARESPNGHQLLVGVPSLEYIRDASLWTPGEMRPLFPSQYNWSPTMFVNGACVTRRIRPGMLALSARFSKSVVYVSFNTLRDSLRSAQRAVDVATREARTRRTIALTPEIKNWIQHNIQVRKPYHILVYLIFVVAQWVHSADVEVDWWTHGNKTMRHMLTEWGPFQCIAPVKSAFPIFHWGYAMMRVAVTVLASVWLRMGDIEFHNELHQRGVSFLEALCVAVENFVKGTLAVRWNTPQMMAALFPPKMALQQRTLFTKTYTEHQIHIGLVFKYMADCAGIDSGHLVEISKQRRGMDSGGDNDDGTNFVPILQGGSPSGLTHIPLNTVDLHNIWKTNDYYNSAFQETVLRRDNVWRPSVETLIFEGDTCIPLPDPSIVPQALYPNPENGMSGGVSDSNSAWRAMRAAMLTRMHNNASEK